VARNRDTGNKKLIWNTEGKPLVKPYPSMTKKEMGE
jgi:hypothetical protein